MGHIRGLLSFCVGSIFGITTSYVGMISGVQKRALNDEKSSGKVHGKSNDHLRLGTEPFINSWIILIIWLYIALNRTPDIDCDWVGAVPKP